MHPANLPDDQLLEQCRVQRTRRSGPGGQHRNKVETAVVLLHEPTGLKAEASERRSQAQNQQQALFRLRRRLAVEKRSEPDKEPPPALSSLWKKRTGGGRISVNPEHPDFPPLLAESLDWLEACDYDPKKAASQLQITPSQLLKFLKLYRPAFEQLNRNREKLGFHPLR